MIRRLIFENWAILCTLIAFVTALSIFLFIGYRALRMSRKDTSRIANIPLEDDEKRVLANREDKGSGAGGASSGTPRSGNRAAHGRSTENGE